MCMRICIKKPQNCARESIWVTLVA
jgi:hypothetical protein